MLSVIIPTIQKKPLVLNKLLAMLEEDDVISEIILINNRPTLPMNVDNYKKVKLYTPESNLFVNKSWNYGMTLISNEYFCIHNDDILPPKFFWKKVMDTKILDEPDTGLVGLTTCYLTNYLPKTEDIEIPEMDENEPVSVKPMDDKYLKLGDWGSIFFGKKSSYYEIPDDFKVIYGDNYLLYQNLLNNKKNYSISNAKINHIHSASSGCSAFRNEVISDIITAEKIDYLKDGTTVIRQ